MIVLSMSLVHACEAPVMHRHVWMHCIIGMCLSSSLLPSALRALLYMQQLTRRLPQVLCRTSGSSLGYGFTSTIDDDDDP